jgi:hypothetical protein
MAGDGSDTSQMRRAWGRIHHALLLVSALPGAACIVPGLSPEGKQCVPGECPDGWKCVYALDAGIGTCQQSGCEGPPAPCERSLGVCAGAVRACLSDGGFEPVCTALSYGLHFQELETLCGDGLDNDCDGRVDVSQGVQLGDSGTVTDLGWVSVDGGFVVVFMDSGRRSGISSQLLNPAFAPLGPAVPVSSAIGADVYLLRVAPFANGAVATWVDQVQHAVMFARISASGQPITLPSTGLPTAVVTNGIGIRSLSVTADPSQQNVLVSWVDSSRYEVQLALVDANGAVSPLPGLAPPDAGAGVDLWAVDVATTPPGYLVGIYLRSKNVASAIGLLFADVSASFVLTSWVTRVGECGTSATPCSPKLRVVSGPGGDAHAAFQFATGGVASPDRIDVLFDPLVASAPLVGGQAPPPIELDLTTSPDDVALAVWSPHGGGALSGQTVTDAGVVSPVGPAGDLTPAVGLPVFFPHIAMSGGFLAAVGMVGTNGGVADGGRAFGEYVCIP